ncbi:DUF2256 domain-containing protein [Psychromonas sp. psych-6C06]|uniref:DUF2256 domain-containing protein n=1 Tax=Psychromonas sp. psych-6C06 TaxID=2058089 RepID=UPI000C33404D|nr:DUF2256 domain-containing protein [Psychromonas sp. psych-6C06]PKF62015.1 DUF2256 domain-containing protein [Psychromonas sp. psych-6C06]
MNNKVLPEKICCVCLRPFTWRKKWAKEWANVKYCSKRCRGNRGRLKSNTIDNH